ncbi:MAG: pyridoxal-phosphate dependent enzyme [Anaerolineaceae bacterium]|nr:pyridoxal-phosphate dependent enzyme [Anaerolineaceae bacterium]
MSIPIFLECVECGHHQDYKVLAPAICSACGSTWLEAAYDYPAFKRELLQGLPGRPFNLWRYHEVLPIRDADKLDVSIAGGTPLVQSHRFAKRFEHDRLYIKDERYGPTNSFKDRQAAVSIAAYLEAGVQEIVIASTGNAAVAYASACARSGVKLWVFMTSLAPAEKLREVALYGAEVVKVSGTYDQTKEIAAEFASRRGLPFDRGVASLPSRESMKTIAYEIVEQLGWKAPDWYVQAVSGGLGPLGVHRGFQELYQLGLIDRIPSLAIIQAEGCSPMAQSYKAGLAAVQPVIPETRIAILSTGNPGMTYRYLYKIVQQEGGAMESVSDQCAFATMQSLAKAEGLAVEPATAVAFAGFEKLVEQGKIRQDELVVINCSGHTFPTEKHVLGEGWGIDVQLSENQDHSDHLREGLRAALERLDQKTTSILIVDDNLDDALLIRRWLQSKKPYRVFEAKDGWDGLTQARQRLPDLIILDLMMPELDGFSVLEELKSDQRTKSIPVIVVSAKDISAEDRMRLNGHIEAIYQKGLLQPHSFVEEVVGVIENKAAQGGDQ